MVREYVHGEDFEETTPKHAAFFLEAEISMNHVSNAKRNRDAKCCSSGIIHNITGHLP